MTESKAKKQEGYLWWSREPAVGVFAVLPLWLCYELLRLTLAPRERNGAEALLSETVRFLGPHGFVVARVLLGAIVVGAAVLIARRRIPWLRVSAVTALEGLVYALILGPLAASLQSEAARLLALQAGRQAEDPLVANLIGSLGAGIFEELLFRLIMVSVLALFLMRATGAFGLPRALGGIGAVLISAVLFALFHHVGPGAAPFERSEFLFRSIAGAVLGLLFVVRGFGVCVYTHAFYDVHYYLTAPP
ncbi:MAG: CPBP family intramembrane glutamic endopeptidase [Planctomycetota bacterium]